MFAITRGRLVAVAFGSTQDVIIMGIWTAVLNVVQGSVIAPLVYGRAVSLQLAHWYSMR